MARFALVLGALSAAGPMAIDMYLPALPMIARDLHATQGQAEWSMTTFFLGLMLGQPFYGPLSDRFGRQPPLLGGMMLFVLASVACSLATTPSVLIVGRFLQGLGSGSAIAISAATIRDRYTGHEAARLLALRVMVLGLSPILSPVLGSALITVVSWRFIFWFAAAYGLLASGLLALIPETRDPVHRTVTHVSKVLGIYGRLIRDRTFIGAVAVIAFMQLAFSAYIADSSFVFIKIDHTPPSLYGAIYASNAIGFISLAQFAPNLMRRFQARRLIMAGSALQAVNAVILFACAATGHVGVAVLIGPLFLFLASFGLVGGPATVTALHNHGPVAGTASSLLSLLQWGSAAVGSGLVALMANGTALPMTTVMMWAALFGLVVAVGAFGGLAGARGAAAAAD
jgi:DHA1 family bicyclomycin/chloramphenicol resistance-like MFS transporter